MSEFFKTKQIETCVNPSADMSINELKKCRKKLIVMHQCGKDKKALIEQLKTVILGIESDFKNFAN